MNEDYVNKYPENAAWVGWIFGKGLWPYDPENEWIFEN
jgi:hypothetical protein